MNGAPVPDHGSGAPILLRTSRLLAAAYIVAILAASCGTWLGLLPLLDIDLVVAATVAVGCVLGAWALRRWRRAPVELRWLAESGWLFALDRGGRLIVGGPLIGCAQWHDLLVVLRVRDGRRRRGLLVAVDALDTATFRLLCVAARRAAGQIR